MPMLLSEVQAEVESWANSINGEYINFDDAFGAQCVDPALHYAATVHGYQRILGHGAFLAGNYISKYGWGDIPAKGMQPGDMVSLNWGGYYGHVLILLRRLSDGRWRILDQNSRGTGDNPSGPCEIRTVSLSSGVVRVARPPRYMGATSTAPEPVKLTRSQILGQQGLYNASALIAAARATNVPLHIAAALIWQESRGLHIYGHDYGGIFSTNPNGLTVGGKWYGQDSNIPVSASNFATFRSLLLKPDGSWTGRTSNGVGPAQITYWASIRDAGLQGYDLADPQRNMEWGLLILKDYLAGDYSEASVKLAATRYNKGPQATAVNKYGLDVWAKSEEIRVALGMDTPTSPGTPDPTPEPEPEPEPEDYTPKPPVTEDPGPRPALRVADVKPVVLPSPEPGPLRPAPRIVQAKGRLWWRDQWWSVLSLSLAHDMPIPGPDQSPIGGTLVPAELRVELARPLVISNYGWDQVRDTPPYPGEELRLDLFDADHQTWVTKFVGEVDESGGSVNEIGVEIVGVQESDALDGRIRHTPLNFRHPSPRNGDRYMSIGLHPLYVANHVARVGGYYATPPADPDTTILSAPMMGSAWSEYGTLFGGWVMDAKGATSGIPSDSPDYRVTPWGLTLGNHFSRWEPRFTDNMTGMLDRPLGIRFLSGPVADDPVHLELAWDRTSIMVQVRPEGLRVETTTGWLPGALRKVAYGRTRALTDEQKRDGFQATIWLHPDGALTTDVDGVTYSHTPFPSYPREFKQFPMTDIRLTARMAATPIGGIVVVMSKDTSVLGDWDRRFIAKADPDHMLFGIPTIQNVNGLDLLSEMAEKALDALWIDEDGRLHYESRTAMDARPSVRTITLDDVERADWGVSRSAVFTHVGGTHLQPACSQTRMSSSVATTLWEGPSDSLRPGEDWEGVASPDAGVDWINMDHTFTKVGRSNVNAANSGVGSLLAGTTRQTDSEGKVEEGVPSISWFNGDVTRLGWDAYAVEVRYRPPDGIVAHFELSAPEIPGLSASVVGKGIILRGRARQVWSEVLTKAVATGARSRRARHHVHDGGWFIQSPLVMGRVLARLAAMLAAPLRAYRELPLAAPDLLIRLGDTVTLTLTGTAKPYRVSGIRFEFTPEAGLSQTLALRQLRP